MQVNVQEFLSEAGITEAIYPGKRFVKTCRQAGDYKSHCVILDWRNPEKLRIEIKAGLSGKDLEPAKLKYYPVCFQTPTYVEIELVNDNDDESEEEGKATGKSGGGGKAPAKKTLDDMKQVAMQAFGDVTEGKIPEVGKIVEMVVMGMQIASEAYANVMGTLALQISHAKISATDLLAKAGDFVTRYTPPSFMKPKGDETAKYKYDRQKNADIGFSKPVVG
jgi:hypothetical protein